LVGLGITQKSSSGLVASGTIASYDQDTFVLKYIQDRSLNLNQDTNDTTDYPNMDASASQLPFESSTEDIKCRKTGSLIFTGTVNQNFTGITTTIGNKNVNLGVEFKNGLAGPEINKKTGDIIYIDNRKEVTRNVRQKEDVKIILEF